MCGGLLLDWLKNQQKLVTQNARHNSNVFRSTLFISIDFINFCWQKSPPPHPPDCVGGKFGKLGKYKYYKSTNQKIFFIRYHHSEVGSNYSTTSAIEARIMDLFQKEFLALLGTFQ